MNNNFYFVLIMNNGEIIHDAFATSHKDLVSKYISTNDMEYFKAMYSPKENCRYDDIDNYQLIICETFIPDWFIKIKIKVEENLRNIIESMVIKGHKQLILHDGVILVGNSIIEETKYSIIFAMYDNARIRSLDYNTEV